MSIPDFWVHCGTSQSNGLGTASSKASGGTGQDANASDTRRFASIPAVTYYQKSADTPAVPGGADQTYNTNIGPVAMAPYAASGNDISSSYAEAYLGIKYGMWASPLFTVHAVGSTTLVPYWGKNNSPATSLYADEVAMLNSTFATYGRPLDVYKTQLGESDANNPSAIAALTSQWTTHLNNLKADCPGVFNSNTLHVFVLVNPNANLPGDGDVASMRAAQIAYITANSATTIGVDPYIIPVPSDPHYRADGYWSLGELIIEAIASRKFPNLNFALFTSPTPRIQGDGPVATTQNNTSTLKPRGAAARVGEKDGRDLQFYIASTYTQATTHTMEIGAGPAGGSGSGGTGFDGGFLQIGSQVDSIFTNHHAMSVWWRLVKDSAMSSDAFGVRHMPTPSVRCASSTLNIGQVVSASGVHPTNPIGGSYVGTNDANNTTLNIPKTAPGSPLQVQAGALAVIFLGENGVSQSVVSITNPDTGAWTIHRDQLVNPGSGSVGLAFASAVCNGGQLRQTTITFSSAGVQVGTLVVLNPINFVPVTGTSTGQSSVTAVSGKLVKVNATAAGQSSATASIAKAIPVNVNINAQSSALANASKILKVTGGSASQASVFAISSKVVLSLGISNSVTTVHAVVTIPSLALSVCTSTAFAISNTSTPIPGICICITNVTAIVSSVKTAIGLSTCVSNAIAISTQTSGPGLDTLVPGIPTYAPSLPNFGSDVTPELRNTVITLRVQFLHPVTRRPVMVTNPIGILSFNGRILIPTALSLPANQNGEFPLEPVPLLTGNYQFSFFTDGLPIGLYDVEFRGDIDL